MMHQLQGLHFSVGIRVDRADAYREATSPVVYSTEAMMSQPQIAVAGSSLQSRT